MISNFGSDHGNSTLETGNAIMHAEKNELYESIERANDEKFINRIISFQEKMM